MCNNFSVQIVILCAALAAAHASLLAAPLVSTGISAESRQQDAWGNYAYGYDIRDGATGSMNAKVEVGKAVAVAAPLGLAAAAPIALANGLVAGNGLLANGVIAGNGILANGVIAGNGILANGLVAGHGLAAPLAIGNGLLGAPIGLGVGRLGLAAPLGIGLGKAIL
ncbi:hypothetical protein AVEN_100581-1 [Araneus ventricosus]|uniref:Uncharacterized protein n=1 Tax=Araneus ventricosus TaxID=182803 RepID=A0A4Y2FKN5_ARAVE|nr:hypothetical protein AVEN_100581-1 [Araneus ventricosus]